MEVRLSVHKLGGREGCRKEGGRGRREGEKEGGRMTKDKEGKPIYVITS
jgi:hypothetical protein